MLCPGSSEVTNFVQAQSTDDTTLVISWEPPVSPNGNITSYSVNITNLRDGSTVRHDIEAAIITLTSLGKWKINTVIHINTRNTEPGVPYNVSIAAVNRAGPGEFSLSIYFTRELCKYVFNHNCHLTLFSNSV